MVQVEIMYTKEAFKEREIAEYKTLKEAQDFINMCLKWGINIKSCNILTNPPDKG